MKELFDAINCAVILRWPSIRPEHEKVGTEHLAMYMFKDSHQFDFVVNLINKRSLQVFCWKTNGRSTGSKELRFISRNDIPFHIKSDGSFGLHNYDLRGQANYVVNEIADFFTPPAERA